MAPIAKTKELIKKLPEQKRHLDFIAALLSVPVLITVLILNLSNLNNKKTTPTPTPTPEQIKEVVYVTPSQTMAKTVVAITASPTPTLTPTSPALCNANIGPVSIDYPEENQSINDNPTCITINYNASGYCAVVWSYKINNSSWSDYSNNSVCLYNLPQGTNTFYLRLKSLVSGNQEQLQRTFTYTGTGQAVTPTPSVVLSPTPTN